VSSPPVIDLRDVSVGYDDRPAVTGVDLTVRAGDVLALIGPNGSGKSTLVRGMLGLAAVLAGDVQLFGVPASRFGERHRLGYVPQRHTVGGAIPSTVEEVVGSGRLTRRPWYARAGASDRAAVAEAIEAVGLSDRRRSMVATLSGGQQRRVLIARALAGRPEVLIMDEPTAGVDAESQQALVHTLVSLVGSGLTLVIVTHEIAPLRPVLTRVVAMRGGRIVHDDQLARSGGIVTGDHAGNQAHGRPDERVYDGAERVYDGAERVYDRAERVYDRATDCHDAPKPLAEVSRLGEAQSPWPDPTPTPPGLAPGTPGLEH
jgi:zinc transport system ATP-binding protein